MKNSLKKDKWNFPMRGNINKTGLQKGVPVSRVLDRRNTTEMAATFKTFWHAPFLFPWLYFYVDIKSQNPK